MPLDYLSSPLVAQQPQQQAQPGQPMMGGGASIEDMLARMTPEQRQQLVGLGALDDENASLDGQLAQARALRTKATTPKDYNNPYAAAVGGLGDIFNSVRSGAQEKSALERQAAIRGQQTQGRGNYMEALVKALRSGNAPGGQHDASFYADGGGTP